VPAYTDWIDRVFDDYGIQYNHAGRLTIIIENAPPVTVHGPACWLTYPGPRFQYGTRDGTTWSHHSVNFNGPRVQRFIESGLFPLSARPPIMPIREAERFHNAFVDLLDSLRAPRRASARPVYLLEGLLLQLHEQEHVEDADPSHEQAIRTLSRDVRADPTREWDFRAAARRMHLSYTHFRRLFRWYIGLAPRQFVIQCRLDEAATLLRDTDMPLKEISAEVGIDDLYYLAKAFRRHYRIAPGAYRREFRRLPDATDRAHRSRP
jgi:AraC-like DNA-binding protein